MAKLAYNELRPGTIFVKDGQLFQVLEYQFVRMQQRKPVAQLKLKNLVSGKVAEYGAHQNEEFEEAEIEKTPARFLYAHRGEYWFSAADNPKDRFSLEEDILGPQTQFLKPNLEITLARFNGKIVSVELPVKVDYKVTEAPPALRGNTAQGGTKAVTIETGVKISAPLFVGEGDVIRVNTATGEYVERSEKAN